MTTPRASLTHSRQDSTAAQTPAAPAATRSLSAPPLPPPDTFDFLPPLYALLRRLQQPSGIEAPPGAPDGAANTQNDSSPQRLDRMKSSDEGKLDISNLDTAASAVRLKIQKARLIVKEMPDVERTVEEQENEIAELERRVDRQRTMLRKLGIKLDGQQDGT